MALHPDRALVYGVPSQTARPLRHWAQVAEQVRARGDDSLRARRHSSDEIRRLCEAFNTMLARLDRDRLLQQALLEASPIALMVTTIPDHWVLHLNAPARP